MFPKGSFWTDPRRGSRGPRSGILEIRIPGAREADFPRPERGRKGAGKVDLGDLWHIEDLGDHGILDILRWGVR